MRRDVPLFPKPRAGLGARASTIRRRVFGAYLAALQNGDYQEEGEVQGPHASDVDLVEPARADEELERDEHKHGEDVEGRLVGEDGVALHAFEGQHGVAELDLGGRVRDDGAEGIGEHRHEDGEEEGVAEEGEGHHQGGSKQPVEISLLELVRNVNLKMGRIKQTDRCIPLPSSPNQIYIIHLPIVL